jgi:mitochondrial chaperone BCS1
MACWQATSSRPKRSLSSIILDPSVKNTLVQDAKGFMESKKWYAERGIPFRRGYLLHGVPGAPFHSFLSGSGIRRRLIRIFYCFILGSGKTSLVHAIAGELELDVYMVMLSRVGMDDGFLIEMLNRLPTMCILLIEDIDASFQHSLSNRQAQQTNIMGHSSPMLSLSGVLNAIDGLGAQEGRIMFATTNHVEALDPALTRPGRMDMHINFGLASKYQAEKLFCKFYVPSGSEIEEQDEDDEDDTNTLVEEEITITPGPVQASASASTSCGESSTSLAGSLKTKLSRRKIGALAKQFGDAVPQGEFSVAALQGHLMNYKTDPMQALLSVGAWITEEIRKRDRSTKEYIASPETPLLAPGYELKDAQKVTDVLTECLTT